jgi:F0F1-type ATP synthase assembly protein I
MPERMPSPKEMGYYWALAQTGFEMIVPIIGGMMLDHYLDWTPWGTIGGVVLGFGGSLTHLIILLRRNDETKKPPQDSPS